MRTTILGLAAALGFAALPFAAQAAPALPASGHTATAGVIEIRGGCGPGYRPQAFRDQWGYWHRRCVPEYYGPRPRYGHWPEPRWGWRY